MAIVDFDQAHVIEEVRSRVRHARVHRETAHACGARSSEILLLNVAPTTISPAGAALRVDESAISGGQIAI